MITLELPYGRKAIIWINEALPGAEYPVKQRSQLWRGVASGGANAASCNVAVEYFAVLGPRISYGLLGASFSPLASDSLSADAVIGKLVGVPYSTSITKGTIKSEIGLPVEYAAAVGKGLETAIMEKITIPSGVLSYDRAVISITGSSAKLFEQLSYIISLLIFSDTTADETSVRDLVIGTFTRMAK